MAKNSNIAIAAKIFSEKWAEGLKHCGISISLDKLKEYYR